MKYLYNIWAVAIRECKILYVNRIYGYCMVVFPLLAMLFFTTLMDDGLPQEMPVGIVDLDNTTMTRSLGQKLDGFQNSHVVARYPSVAEARKAMQKNEIYGFLYLPKGTTDNLLASRRPTISYYYSQTSAQIAEEWKLSDAAVRKRLSPALNKLRELLSEQDSSFFSS